MGRSVFNVKVGPSPAWLKQRLESLDVNSINNIVDITNFVMLELGQPMHAFDSALVENQKIEISSSKKGEKFQTLDGTELELTGEELMIRDGSKPVAMAGVIGGKNSGVTESTKNIFLESAHFTPQTVRKSSRRFGIEKEVQAEIDKREAIEKTKHEAEAEKQRLIEEAKKKAEAEKKALEEAEKKKKAEAARKKKQAAAKKKKAAQESKASE